ncbi:hypothetical protein HY641_03470 [Candidatus Woesearchaeota archaeon]|nr:hypothetical protein [Candidatus Woesearchaeota archaeon]
MVIENAMLDTIVMQQLMQNVSQVYSLLTYITGGVVGLYVILILIRWYELRKMKTVMNHVEMHLRRLSQDVHQLKVERHRR